MKLKSKSFKTSHVISSHKKIHIIFNIILKITCFKYFKSSYIRKSITSSL